MRVVVPLSLPTIQQIQEDNLIREVKSIDQALMKPLYVFRMAMACIDKPGARTRALNAAEKVVKELHDRYAS